MNVYKLWPYLDNVSCGLCCIFSKNTFNEISFLKMCYQLIVTLKDLTYVSTDDLFADNPFERKWNFWTDFLRRPCLWYWSSGNNPYLSVIAIHSPLLVNLSHQKGCKHKDESLSLFSYLMIGVKWGSVFVLFIQWARQLTLRH